MKFIPILTSTIPAMVEQLAKRGARPFTVTLSTSPKFLKKARGSFKGSQPIPEHLLQIRKVSVINCFLNFDYAGAVNRQRTREDSSPDFEALPAWFEHTSIKGIVALKSDTTKLYLQLKVEKILSVEYVGANGERWTREKFEAEYSDYLPVKAKPSARQELEKPILTMTPSLDSIVGFSVDGKSYQVAKTITLAPVPKYKQGKASRGHSPLLPDAPSFWPMNADRF